MVTARPNPPHLHQALARKLILVSGKGGVGKTTVSMACALALANQRKRTLWMTFDDPSKPRGEIMPLGPNLYSLNVVADVAFEQYIGMKIRIPLLAKLFVRNPLMRYLANAGPGIHELVMLGKVWHERQNFDHVVVDMPSTGFSLSMFESTRNFARLFKDGSVRNDAEHMLETFGNPSETAHVIVALPEEMPLREGLDLDQWMGDQFPDCRPAFAVNAIFPKINQPSPPSHDELIARSGHQYVTQRNSLEQENMRIWDGLPFTEFPLLKQTAALTQDFSKLIDVHLKKGQSP